MLRQTLFKTLVIGAGVTEVGFIVGENAWGQVGIKQGKVEI